MLNVYTRYGEWDMLVFNCKHAWIEIAFLDRFVSQQLDH